MEREISKFSLIFWGLAEKKTWSVSFYNQALCYFLICLFVWITFWLHIFFWKYLEDKKIPKPFRGAKNENCWHFWRSKLASKGTKNGLKSKKPLYLKKLNSLENVISFRFFQCQNFSFFFFFLLNSFLEVANESNYTHFALNCNYHIGSAG